MEEEKLSAYALLTAKSIELLDQLSTTYQSMGDMLKNIGMMTKDLDVGDIGAYAAAEMIRDIRVEAIGGLEHLPEKEALEEFLANMTLHSMWVPK